MSAVSRFEVIFNRQSGRYMEGDTVTGVVAVDLKEDSVIEKLEIVFRGQAVVQWTKAVERNSRSRPTMLPGPESDERFEEEQYLNQKLDLYTREDNQKIMVRAGRQTYPFSIQLPESLPSTFVGDYGFIRYFASVRLEFPFQSPLTTFKEFFITSFVNLSSTVMEPVMHRNLKTHNIICFTVGDIHATWRLNRTGFLPGDQIEINADIENNSRFKISKTKVSLIQHIRYQDAKGLGNEIYQRKRVVRMQKSEIHPGEFGFWREKMKIPNSLPPSGLKGCNIINMWYTLKLIVVPVLFKPIENVTEITLGSKPNTSRLDIRSSTTENVRTPPKPETSVDANSAAHYYFV